MSDDAPRNDLPYLEAAHGMQTGVAHELEHDPTNASPKHLRVGVNSALVNDAALVRLLVAKHLFTWEEYNEAVRLEMNRELDRYEDRIRERVGHTNVNLR